MKHNYSLLYNCFTDGGLFRFIIITSGIFIVLLLTSISIYKAKNRKRNIIWLWLIYISLIVFFIGIIKETLSARYYIILLLTERSAQGSLYLRYYSGLIAYSLVSLVAIIGSFIAKILDSYLGNIRTV